LTAQPDPGAWLSCYSGGRFYPFAPRVQDVRLVDLAHHLATSTRWLGALHTPLSIAQHSVNVGAMARALAPSAVVGAMAELAGLVHDTGEAYVGDMPRPIKRAFPAFVLAENRALAVVLEALGIAELRGSSAWALALQCDRALLATEARDNLGPRSFADHQADDHPGSAGWVTLLDDPDWSLVNGDDHPAPLPTTEDWWIARRSWLGAMARVVLELGLEIPAPALVRLNGPGCPSWPAQVARPLQSWPADYCHACGRELADARPPCDHCG